MPAKKNPSSQKEISISKSLEELEKIVDTMEEETLDLEESLKLFEKGIGLIKNCQSALTTAEQKVKQLTKKGNLIDFEPMDEDE